MAQEREDPRIARSRAAVLDATLAELAEVGFGRLTIDGVAERAGVARSTVYRLWPDRTALVADAFATLNRQPVPGAEAAGDVRALLAHLDRAWNDEPVGACLPALVDGAARDEAVADFLHDYSRTRGARLVDAVRAGVEEGAWPGTDPELAAAALAGALLYLRLLTPRRLDERDLDRLVEVVLGPRD